MNASVQRRLVWGLLAASALAIASGLAGVARADMGPKPSMLFVFTFANPDQTIESGVLLSCENAGCVSPTPLLRRGPQGFDCKPRACFATAYGFLPYGKLELMMSDGRVLRSNVFKTPNRLSRYKVAVAAARLNVQPAE
jgi:hypothetical protein